MADNARALYDSLVEHKDLAALVGRPEDIHLEVKECDSGLTSRIKGYMSQALSGFANSDGGVLILGLTAKSESRDEPDIIIRVKPFPRYETAASAVRALVGDAVMPIVSGVLVSSVPGATDGYGYVKILIPASDGGPHRAILKEVGEREYWKRSVGSFYRMEHFDIADMLGRRRRPDLRVEWRPIAGKINGDDGELRLVLTLVNEGRGIARFPMLQVDLSKPLVMFEYGLDGNRRHGLEWRRLSVGSTSNRHAFVGTEGHVVHPGVPFDVTVVTGVSIRRHADQPWEYFPRELVIPYRVAAEEMAVRDGSIRIDVEAELERIKSDLGW